MLKKLFALSLVIGLLAVTTGCPSKDKDKKKTGTGTPTGKTGTEATGTKATEGDKKEAKLEIEDIEAVTLKQGSEMPVTVKVKRTNTEEVLNLKVEKLPNGVTVKEKAEDLKILGDKSEGMFTLKAADDAKVSKDNMVKVTVSDAAGKITPSPNKEFKVTVESKK